MTYLILGFTLFGLGLLHRIETLEKLENQVIFDLQSYLNTQLWLLVFRELWFFGRTSFTIVSLLLYIIFNWKLGITAIGVFIIIAGLETFMKSYISRSRPFQLDPKIRMLQPQQPDDPSFPSGDTFRVWYLALILAAALGSNPLLLGGLILLALLVSLGRLVMGVHYLTDVLAGAGLGIMGAGIVLLLWNAFNLI
jgi:undecaprenyl-diphosphatase